jgi:hypothetical protein
MRPVTETVMQERCYTVMRPVTTYRTVTEDRGCWTTQRVCIPGPVVPRLVCDPCCGVRVCMVRCPGIQTCRRVWQPNVVCRQIPCTTYCPQVVRQQCPVQVCKYVPECVVEKVPYRTCKMVCEEIVEKVPVRTCRWVRETHTQRVPVRTCRMICETQTRKVPIQTCRWVEETCTRKVAFCVTKQVPYTVTERVAHCVAKCVPETCTRMVAKCVPRQVAYEVCRMVPVTVCPNACGTPGCSDCATGDCGLGSSATPTYEGTDNLAPIPERAPITDPTVPEV